MTLPAISLWGCDDVGHWLRSLDLGGEEDHAVERFGAHAVDGRALPMLSEADLKEMGLNLVGARKRLLCAIRALAAATDPPLDDGAAHVRLLRPPEVAGDLTAKCKSRGQDATRWPPEYWKTVVAFAYINFAGFVSACVLVIAHERLPNTIAYPPLPDLLLDNLPHVSWAFEAAEFIAVVLFALFAAVVVLHRHKAIILRRLCTLFGTVFLLRSVTLIITSLSVPGRHLQEECRPLPLGSLENKMRRAFQIWSGFGMTLGGVKTCGDYMFSGHSVVLTMLNFFVTEYTPGRWHIFHTFVWLLYVFGLFFIMAAHEHYSIDVFVAVYISSRLFLYYHAIANNRSLMTRDQKRWRLWFPLLHFFESGCDGVVPNEYGPPLPKKVLDFFLASQGRPLSERRAPHAARKDKRS